MRGLLTSAHGKWPLNHLPKKQNCLAILNKNLLPNDKLERNNCKNVNLLIAHSIDEDIKVYVLKPTASDSFKEIYTLRPKPKEQKVIILAKV